MSVGYEEGAKNHPNAQQGRETPDWDTLKDDVTDIAGVAVERGRHFLDSARDQATLYVDKRKDDVAQSVADFATSLRESTSSFEDRPNIRAFVDSAAEGLDQLAGSIRERSFAEIFNQAEDVMRERPAAVAAVTLVIGFAAARFIKASAEGMRQGYGPGGAGRRQGGSARMGERPGERQPSGGGPRPQTRTGA